MIAKIPHHLGQLLSQRHGSADRHHLEPPWRVSSPPSHAPEETAVPVAARLTCRGCPGEQTLRPPVQESPSHRQHAGEGSALTAIDAHQAIPLGTQMPGPQVLKESPPTEQTPPTYLHITNVYRDALALTTDKLPRPHLCSACLAAPRPRRGTATAPRPPPTAPSRPPKHDRRDADPRPAAAARDPAADADTPKNPLQNRRVETPGRRPQTHRPSGTSAQTTDPPPPGNPLPTPTRPRTRFRTAGSGRRGADPRPAAAARDQFADADTPKNPLQNHWVETPRRRPQTHRPPGTPVPTLKHPRTRLRTTGSRRRGEDPRRTAARDHNANADSQEPTSEPIGGDAGAQTPDPPAARDPAADADTPKNPLQNRRVGTPRQRTQTRCRPGTRCRRRHAQEPASEPPGRDAEAKTQTLRRRGTRCRCRHAQEPASEPLGPDAEAKTPDVQPPGTTLPTPTPKNPPQNHWVETPRRRPQTYSRLGPQCQRRLPRTHLRTNWWRRRGADPRPTGRPGPRCRRRHAQEPASEPPGRDAGAQTPDPPSARDPAAVADTPKNPLQNRRVGTPRRRTQTLRRPGTRCRRRHAQEPASEPPGRDAGVQTPDPPLPPGTNLPMPTRPRTRFRTTGSRRRGEDPRRTAARDHNANADSQEPTSEPIGGDAGAQTPDPPAARDPAADAETPKNPPQNRRVGTPGCKPQTRRCRPGPICRCQHAQEPVSEPLGRDAEAQTTDPPPPGNPLPTPTRPRTRFRTTGSRRRGEDPRPAAAREPATDADTPKNPLQNRRVETPRRRPQTLRRPGTRCRRRHAQEPASEPPGRDAAAQTPDPTPPGNPLPTPKNRSQPRTVHTRTPPETLARQLTVAAAVAERPRGRLLRDTRAHKLRP
ncbi:serine/arginine repetitive matrix protein 1-like [Lynx rufus]|uniref:serine/arginine repetitive matrix protein 1-like n=1 Tax=Lynx rufus TaxID=61384 RepID=UPI001F126B4B|nr:serine/arginine repetitive matrix protein 1-like [Lynx rufus]